VFLFLLVGHCSARAFAGAGVCAGALASYGQTSSVADASVTADFDEALDVQRDFAAQIAFHCLVFVDYFTDFGGLVVC
jgi:hypothetical protein